MLTKKYIHQSRGGVELNAKVLGLVDYETTWQNMQELTASRDQQTADEIWVLEHPPVFTLGQASKPEHLLNTGDIPVVQTDRGGQVTYHGPGQLVIYPLIDIKRLGINVRPFVSLIEQAIVDCLDEMFALKAFAKQDAPGVYITTQTGDAKIASLGLRIKKGCSFHGLSVNVNMSLEPFLRINPCGYAGMQMIQVSDFVTQELSVQQVGECLLEKLCAALGYTAA